MDTQTAIQVLTEAHGASLLRAFSDPADAVHRLMSLEATQREVIRSSAEALRQKTTVASRLEMVGYYPILAIPVATTVIADHSESYGWTRAGHGKGLFYSTFSQTELHQDYLLEQIG